MFNCTAFINQAAELFTNGVKKKVVADIENLQGPIAPAVQAPNDFPAFDEPTLAKIGTYKNNALIAENFEQFTKLIEDIANALALVPDLYRAKIASVLNRYRVDSGLAPL